MDIFRIYQNCSVDINSVYLREKAKDFDIFIDNHCVRVWLNETSEMC